MKNRNNKKSFASKVANVAENANRSLISELTNNRGALTIQYKTGALIKGNTDSKKVIIDFGSHKDKYDELPSGRKYLTPEEIAAIQELEFEDNCPLRIVRDAFTLSCLYGGRAADYLDKNTNWEAYYHCVGALLILAGIVKPVFGVAGGNKHELYYHSFYANPFLARHTYAINRHYYPHVYARFANA